MCHETVSVPIPDFLMDDAIRDGLAAAHPEYAYNTEGVPCFRLDRCIVAAVEALWAAGIRTLGCCCGHGSRHGVISIETEGPAARRSHRYARIGRAAQGE